MGVSWWQDLLQSLGLGAFHFLRPQWLWAVLPAVLLPLAVHLREDLRRRWRGVIAPHLLAALTVAPRRRWRMRPGHLTALGLGVAAVALAGPTWEQERPPFVEDKAPLAVAIDLSRTMDAIDVSPTRLERAKLKVKALLARRAGARTAIWAYAGSTHLVLPLTEDAALVGTFVDALQTRIMPAPGKDTALALRTIAADLAREDVPGTVLFLTDGVEPAAVSAFAALPDDGGVQPLVLAIGTEQGGPVRSGPNAFAEDASGRRLFARLDLATLHRLRDAGVPVATFTAASDEDVDWVQRRVQSHLVQKQADAQARWKEAGWWLTLPLTLFGALWFRKGWTVRWASLGMLLLLLAVPAPRAAAAAEEPPGGWRFVDLWLTRDQQGRRAYERGDYLEAARLFEDPMWRGIALYRAGRDAEAVQSFALVRGPESEFNQGNALARQGQFPAAAARYRQALRLRPAWPPAQANLALVEKLIPPAKKDPGPQAEDPNLKPDEVQFDDQGKAGKEQVRVPRAQTADTWMRAIQTTPTELLARKFALQHGAKGRP